MAGYTDSDDFPVTTEGAQKTLVGGIGGHGHSPAWTLTLPLGPGPVTYLGRVAIYDCSPNAHCHLTGAGAHNNGGRGNTLTPDGIFPGQPTWGGGAPRENSNGGGLMDHGGTFNPGWVGRTIWAISSGPWGFALGPSSKSFKGVAHFNL